MFDKVSTEGPSDKSIGPRRLGLTATSGLARKFALSDISIGAELPIKTTILQKQPTAHFYRR
jgi:hypothetical protein